MSKKLFLFPLLVAAACSSPEPRDPGPRAGCTGKCDGVEVTPLLRCTPSDAEVECVSAVPAWLPLDGVELLLYQTNGGLPSVRLPSEPSFRAAPGEQVTVIAMFASQDTELFHSLDDSNGFSLIQQTFVLDGAKTTTLDMPFDLWRIELRSDVFADAKLDPYTVSVAPWKADQKNIDTIERGGVRLPFIGKDPLTIAVVAPRGAKKLSGKLSVFNDDDGSEQKGIAFELTGSGSYVVSASGIVRDSSAEPPPVVATPDMAPPVDPVDPNDTDPTCGGHKQPQCSDASGWETCDEGKVYLSSDDLCHTCGGNDQPQCRDASGFSYCAEGFVYVGLQERCFACGRDAQPRCNDASGFPSCNDGFTYSSSDGLCHAP